MKNTDVKIPALRFPEFSGEWEEKRLGQISEIVSGGTPSTTNNNYWENGNIRWMNSGELNLKKVYEVENRITELGFNNSSTKLIPQNSVLVGLAGQGKTRGTVAINKVELCINQSIGAITPNSQYNADFIYYNLDDRYQEFRQISDSGGGRGGLNLQTIKRMSIIIPSLLEQQKIADFLSAVDKRLHLLKDKKTKLEEYKRGVMQRIFSQELRFTRPDGSAYPDWGEKRLDEVLFEHKSRNLKLEVDEVFSVAKEKGVINQIEHLGRSYAADNISNYKIVYPFDLIYTKSPTSGFPFGIIKQNKTDRTGVVSTLYGVFRPNNKFIGYYLDAYFSSEIRTYNYLVPLVQKGAKNTMNINNKTFLNGAKISLPSSEDEQRQIADFLSAIDNKIALLTKQIESTEQYKKGLLQQMFV